MTWLIQEAHKLLYHTLCLWWKKTLRSLSSASSELVILKRSEDLSSPCETDERSFGVPQDDTARVEQV